MATVSFFKCSLWSIAILRRGLEIYIFLVIFLVWRRGVTKNSTLCKLLIFLTILDDPLYRDGFTQVEEIGSYQVMYCQW